MYTYQDISKFHDKASMVSDVISDHLLSEVYRLAKLADLYDRQMNKTIHDYVRTIFSISGSPVEDFTASNNKIASNFFHRLNTQRCTYSLGNGISFNKKESRVNEDGSVSSIDVIKEKLGPKFDTDLKTIGYNALIHGVSFGFWNVDRLYPFSVTEFAPLWDENDGSLRAGVRFWKLAPNKPVTAVLYEEDGYTKYRSKSGDSMSFVEIEPKRGYMQEVRFISADPSSEAVAGEYNYGRLPIIPMWGSHLKQSTLVGMQQSIDSYDLIRSGFANDLTDCAQIYWIVENCGGMSDSELARFRDRLKINHIANVDSDNGGRATPFTQNIPYDARKEYLSEIRSGIYEDFGGLDVHAVSAGATNDHIDAAYQPLDENADDFEYQVIEFVQQVLRLIDEEDTPVFKRNRISNQKEQTEMLMSVANYLDDETILNKLPFVTPDEVRGILSRKDAENSERMAGGEEYGEQLEDLEE